MNAFEMKKLNLIYGKDQAFNNINIDIEKNKLTAFIGPSGCRKSTWATSSRWETLKKSYMPENKRTENYITGRFG